MILIGESENLIVACNSELGIDIFDMKLTDEKFSQVFERKFNPTNSAFEKQNIPHEMKFSLKLASSTSPNVFSSRVVSIYKKLVGSNLDNNDRNYTNNTNINTNTNKSKVYRLFMLDAEGSFIVYEILEVDINYHSISTASTKAFPLKIIYKVNFQNYLIRAFNVSPELNFTDFTGFTGNSDIKSMLGDVNESIIKFRFFNLSKKYSNSFTDIIYVLTNLGLVKIKIQGRDDIIVNILHSDKNDFNKVLAIDVSDTGHLFIAYSDFTLKILDEKDFNKVFQASASTLSHDTYIDKIICANIICKNEGSKLIRKSLVANFYLITSKNEFIIYDLHQKNLGEIKKIKKKIDLGSKKGLTKRNSLLSIS